MTTMDHQLFPKPLMQLIDRVRLGYGVCSASRNHGEVRALRKGHGIEFCDHRPYLPGDDFRVVDWNAYQRNRELLVRLFYEIRDLPIHILLDCSASMGFGESPAATTARQAAALLCGAAIRDYNMPTIRPFQEAPLAPIQATRPPGFLLHLLRKLGALPMCGQSDLEAALASMRRVKAPPGLVILISDLFDPSGPHRFERVLQRLTHRLVILQITRADDAEPAMSGEVRIEDCETGRTVDLEVTPELRRRHREAYEDFNRTWQGLSSRHGIPLIPLDAKTPFLDQLPRLMAPGLLRTC
jgi:uncharacterized protein (DUF58 family)